MGVFIYNKMCCYVILHYSVRINTLPIFELKGEVQKNAQNISA